MNKTSNVTTKPKSTKQNKQKTKSKKSKGNVQKLRDEPTFDKDDYGMFYFLSGILMDSRISLLKCKWASVDVNCSDNFYNHLIDYRMHFSFNLHPDALLADHSSGSKNTSYFFRFTTIVLRCTMILLIYPLFTDLSGLLQNCNP